ncbi:hypothetical protein AtubIFM54640_002950, partial [Aspergillus tubingensis]
TFQRACRTDGAASRGLSHFGLSRALGSVPGVDIELVGTPTAGVSQQFWVYESPATTQDEPGPSNSA